MPSAADKKRKKADSGKSSPAKKRKVDTSSKKTPVKSPKKTAAKPKKDISVSKAKKTTPKGIKAKPVEKSKKTKPVAKKEAKKPTFVKKIVKSKPANKTSSKPGPSKVVKKQVVKQSKKVAPAKSTTPKKVETSKRIQPKKVESSKKKENLKTQNTVKQKQLAVKTLTRGKLDSAKAKTAQAKLKAAKASAKANLQKRTPIVRKKEEKKPEPKKPEPKQKEQEKKELPKTGEKPKAAEKKTTQVKQPEKKIPEKAVDKSKSTNNKKRKNEDKQEPVETPRKKRIITPNKRYADFETDTSPKRISELRAFVQDKKKTPAEKKTENPVTISKAATKQESTPVKQASQKSSEEDSKQSPQIKVIKASEMKPAEKLLKKLQKKLEKEAKASMVKSKQSPNKDPARVKITKVVTYNKPPVTKAATKNLFPKAKANKPAAAVKKPSPDVEKAAKASPKVVHSPKKIKEQKKDDRKIQAKFLFQKNVRQADDANTTCWVTGIDVFKSGEVVLIDMANKKIKLFNSALEYMSQAKLDTTPQDISISPVDASVAYFTKPFSKEGIQKVCLSDGTLTLKDSFLTNGTNRGIKCVKSGILTSVQNGRYHDLDINCFKIELLDYKGNILQSVSMTESGMRLFKLPLYFTVNNGGKQIIVSDCIRNNSYILSLDMTGKIKFKFTGVRDNPITPRGLTTDDDNNIYVTEWERHNVYILTPAGKRQQVLLEHNEQLKEGQDGLKKPYQLCYYKYEDQGRLIVSQESCNAIKVFQITQRQPDQNGAAADTANSQTVAAAATPTKATASPTKAPSTPQPPVASTQQVVPAAQDTAKVIEVKTITPAVLTLPASAASRPVPDEAASILSKEHAYTTLAAPAERLEEEVVPQPMNPASDPVELEGPGELSSLVDSIISDLNSREQNTVASLTDVVVQDQLL